jgi:GT2 family glycosyltransferase
MTNLADTRRSVAVTSRSIGDCYRRQLMVTPVRHHGLLLTFRRPVALDDHLEMLASQTAGLDTLLVVDNDDDPKIRAALDTHPNVAGELHYIGIDDNPGPAGGIAAGVAEILARAADDDWLVLLDDDDPPARAETFAALREVIDTLTSTGARVGGVGLWGARVRRTGRLRVDTSTAPRPVDYLPGGSCVHYRVGALRECDGLDPTLFFGFDDLDLGLSLRRAGWPLYSSGLAREHGLAHMVEGRRASATVTPSSWRRYYSLRNLIIVLRRDRQHSAALAMTLGAGLLKPMLNLLIRPRVSCRNLGVNARAIGAGWRGRSGKTVDPLDPPPWLR